MNGPPWYTSPPDPPPTPEELLAACSEIGLSEAFQDLKKYELENALAAVLSCPLTAAQHKAIASHMERIGDVVGCYLEECRHER